MSSMKERLEEELRKAALTSSETERLSKQEAQEASRQKKVEQAKQEAEQKIAAAIQKRLGIASIMILDSEAVDGTKIQEGRPALLSPAYREMWDWLLLEESLPANISPVINYREIGKTSFLGRRSLEEESKPCLEVVIKRKEQQ